MEAKTRGGTGTVEVIRGVRDVAINEDIPDAKAFADKYDVEMDDPTAGVAGKDDREAMQDIILNQDLVQRTDGLVRKLDEKNREIDRLCTLLESVAVVPGMKPDRILDIYDNIAEEPIDLRDSKIVHLAKKVRGLTLALNKEKSLRHASESQVEEYRREIDQLKRDLELISSPAARAAARAESKESKPGEVAVSQKDFRKELAAANKQVEDLRHKLHASTEENKRIQRALVKEIGDSSSCEQALEDGWKGRAQQIIMLKNKIKRLEAGVDVSTGSSATARLTQRRGVDAKAELDLAEMSSERQRAVENLTTEHSRLVEEHQDLVKKCERHKIRVRLLEGENSKHKENLKMMVDKGDSDDQLIEALKEENQNLRVKLQNTVQKQREMSLAPQTREVRAAGVNVTPSGTTEMEAEISRLNRLIKQQTSQLNAQDALIHKLRSSETPKYG